MDKDRRTSEKGKGLRFASLIRVSTEKQEKKGGSLAVQLKGNTEDVERLGGEIVEWYGGQEHATVGWERKELSRLVADAKKGKFDAVIVQWADRWSRDHVRSEQDLDTLRDHDIQFYIGTAKQDLYDDSTRLNLGVHTLIGKFIASQQLKKAMQTKIDRAQKGLPSCGNLPFGRTFIDGQWGLDAKAHRIIQDAARRYLDGESLDAIATEFGMKRWLLHRVLTERSGDTWVQTFDMSRYGIKKPIAIPTEVPPLLDGKTIKAVRDRAKNRRVYSGTPRHHYLLSGRVYCHHCGTSLTGQHRSGHRFYRHNGTSGDRAKNCDHRGAWVRADRLEDSVLELLFTRLVAQ